MDIRRLIFTLFVAVLAVSWTTCAKTPVRTQPGFHPADSRWVEKTLRTLTLEEKIGQMIGCRFSGIFSNAGSERMKELDALVANHKIGVLGLFGGEVYETAHLTNRFQKLAAVPLLFASDFERGAGNQITGATLFPPLMSIGAARSEELAYDMGRITALEGRALGVHMTWAPVVDVNVNPDNPIINTRSAGEDPELVSRLAGAFIRGCQENGLIATAKHFPGHGDTALDSHSLLPTIGADRDRLDRVELYPFKQAVRAGVGAVMTSHLFVPALDPTPNLPATLSKPILTGILRGSFGFKGLIVTDALEMGGITKAYASEEAALKAVLAGADILLLSPEPAKVIARLAAAVRSGGIPPARIDESVRRILEVKAKLGLHKNRFVSIEALERRIAAGESLERAGQAFESSVTLVKNGGDLLPLDPAKKIAVFSLSSDPGDYFAGREFVSGMMKINPATTGFYADADTGREDLDGAAAKSADAGVAVFALFSSVRAWKGSVDIDPKHVRLIEKLKEAGKPVVCVSFGSPYFLRHFPGVDAYLCLYRNTPQTQTVAVRALYGEVDVQGRLPVSIPGLYPFGHGLSLKKR
ncbi:MAG: glycoside hydrolase family 3 protein [Acidobacteriota bacterium]|nr:glycoside hydrolase family 3 protein [Acidobacteriota bacterium]